MAHVILDVIDTFVRGETSGQANAGIAGVSELIYGYADDVNPRPINDAETFYYKQMEMTVHRQACSHWADVSIRNENNIARAERPLSCRKRNDVDLIRADPASSVGDMIHDSTTDVDIGVNRGELTGRLRLSGSCRDPHHLRDGFVCGGCKAIAALVKANDRLWNAHSKLTNDLCRARSDFVNMFRAAKGVEQKGRVRVEYHKTLYTIKALWLPEYEAALERAKHAYLVDLIRNTCTPTTAVAGDKRTAAADPETATPSPAKKRKIVHDDDAQRSAILFHVDGKTEFVKVPESGFTVDDLCDLLNSKPVYSVELYVRTGSHTTYVEVQGASQREYRNDAATRSFGSSTTVLHGNVLLCDAADVH